ncbi:hypothetical protein PFISCL1PPCAC_8095, partial [Pristionchus fissidentatus]
LLLWISPHIILSAPEATPQCSDLMFMQGEVYSRSSSPSGVSFNRTTSSTMGLHQTACLEIPSDVNGSSVLHSLTFVRVEQLHPVTSFYRFAYPLINTKCVCDCQGGDSHCNQLDYQYRNCTSGAACYRTYHAWQSSEGCFVGGQSEVCCEIRVDPYKDQTFTAVKIGQPDTNIIMKYQQFESTKEGKWILIHEKGITIPLNRGPSRVETGGNGRLIISVSGSGPSKVLPTNDVYFFRDGTSELRGGVRLNEISDSSVEKLGWLRQDSNGRWSIPNGLLKITHAHSIKVLNCKEQQFMTALNADQYVLNEDGKESTRLSYGHPLTDWVWVESAAYEERIVRVRHAEGTTIEIRMSSEKRPFIRRDVSQLGWFDGEITVDSLSQHILNLTFHESKGTFLGNVYSSEARERNDYSFSVTIGDQLNKSTRIAASIDSSVNSRRYVCFYPTGDPQKRNERCKWLPFKSTPISTPPPIPGLLPQTGHCANCNEVGPQAFMQYLNPSTWFNGGEINLKMIVMAVLEGLVFFFLVYCIIMIVTKCFIPLIRCSLYVPKPLHRGCSKV